LPGVFFYKNIIPLSNQNQDSLYIYAACMLSVSLECNQSMRHVAGTLDNQNHWADVISIESSLIKEADKQPSDETVDWK